MRCGAGFGGTSRRASRGRWRGSGRLMRLDRKWRKRGRLVVGGERVWGLRTEDDVGGGFGGYGEGRF